MEGKTQEQRIKELLDKYTSFIHQTQEEKIKVIRLCSILAYLEALAEQNITVGEAISQLEKFLDKIIKRYTGGENNGV